MEGRLRFSKVLDLQKLTGRLLRTLDQRATVLFNQLSGTKLLLGTSGHKSTTARFFMFSIYPGTRNCTRGIIRKFSIRGTTAKIFFYVFVLSTIKNYVVILYEIQ